MATFGGVRGPLPKMDPEKRASHRPPAFQTVDLDPSASAEGAPPLPGADGYLEETRSWYQTWVGSPQALQFLATDWQRLHMLAPLVDRYLRDVRSERPEVQRKAAALLSHIVMSETKLGATAQDRLALRWRMRSAEREAEAAEQRASASAESAPARRSSRSRRDPRLSVVEGKAS